jgi:hypothetical protein
MAYTRLKGLDNSTSAPICPHTQSGRACIFSPQPVKKDEVIRLNE